LSPRWNENILYFHNKQFINKFNLEDVYIHVMKHLFNKKEDNYDVMMELLGDKSKNIIINDVIKLLY